MKNTHIAVRYTLIPRHGVNTSVKGWMDNDRNTQWDEQFSMTEGLKKRDYRDAQVILDIDDKKIIKNWKAGEGENDFDALYAYYYKNYTDYMDRFMRAMASKA